MEEESHQGGESISEPSQTRGLHDQEGEELPGEARGDAGSVNHWMVDRYIKDTTAQEGLRYFSGCERAKSLDG